MNEFKVNDEAWIVAVWSQGENHSKVNCLISKVTISKIYEGNDCVVLDQANMGHHCKLYDLYRDKESAYHGAILGLHRWNEL